MSSEETIKKLIKKDHPKLSDDEVDEIIRRLDQLADMLFDDWIKLKEMKRIDHLEVEKT